MIVLLSRIDHRWSDRTPPLYVVHECHDMLLLFDDVRQYSMKTWEGDDHQSCGRRDWSTRVLDGEMLRCWQRTAVDLRLSMLMIQEQQEKLAEGCDGSEQLLAELSRDETGQVQTRFISRPFADGEQLPQIGSQG